MFVCSFGNNGRKRLLQAKSADLCDSKVFGRSSILDSFTDVFVQEMHFKALIPSRQVDQTYHRLMMQLATEKKTNL